MSTREAPIACTLTAGELQCAAQELLPGLARIARISEQRPDGVRFEFDAVPGIVPRIADVIERERQCCGFLRFALDVASEGEAITLLVEGPPGTGVFLESLGLEFHSAGR